jgi:hypothetical protein
MFCFEVSFFYDRVLSLLNLLFSRFVVLFSTRGVVELVIFRNFIIRL